MCSYSESLGVEVVVEIPPFNIGPDSRAAHINLKLGCATAIATGTVSALPLLTLRSFRGEALSVACVSVEKSEGNETQT